VDRATCWGDDDVAAFAACLRQDFDLVLWVCGKLFIGGHAPGDLGVAGHGVILHAVQQVQAAGRGPFGVSVFQ
jgi:hypothetical protein